MLVTSRGLILFVIAMSVAGCDTVPIKKRTASGYPEAIFYGKNLKATGEMISNACVSKGLVPENVTTNSVTCTGRDIEPDFMQMISGEIVQKNVFKFFMVASGKNTKVIAKKQVLTSDQIERETNFFPSEVNKLQDWLYEIGARD